MENYNEEQMREQMRRRQDMFKKMGAPNAGKVINETAVAAGGNSMAAKLQAIKSGAAKSDFSKYVNAATKGGGNSPGGAGFQGIPEHKQKKGPKEEVNPEYKQSLEEFSEPRSSGNSELDAINAMFGDMGGSSVRPSQNMGNPNDFSMNMDIDSAVMPSFNPQAALQQKARQTSQMMNNQNNQDNPYLKFASNTPQPQQQYQQPEQYMQEAAIPMNMQNLQVMMETIAKGIAEKTIRSVLNEYTTQQKSKLQFEYYNKEKGIIQTPDGKLYRLQPVEVKKK